MSAEPGVLEIDEGVFEILSYLSGETMSDPQRRALLPTLTSLLAGEVDTRGPEPLSQAGALGAILGVLHFALRRSGRWWFTQLPHEGRATPDIFAISETGEIWNLECKGVAPHSGEFPPRPGARIDICHDRIRRQRDKGRDQLAAGFVVPVPGGPSLRLPAGFGGRALAVSVLSDGRLAERTDLLPAAKRGCPDKGPRCAEVCLAAQPVDGGLAVVGLLWEASVRGAGPDQSRPPDNSDGPDGRRIVGALHAAACAAWARSTQLADDALAALPERLQGVAEARALALRVLRATRGVSTVGARSVFAQHFHSATGDEDLDAETRLGVIDPPRLVNVGDAVKSFESAPVQAVALGELRGRLDPDGLRLVPPLAWIDAAVTDGQDDRHRLLDRVDEVLRREMFRGSDLYAARNLYARLGDQTAVIGRSFGHGLALAPGVPDRLPRDLRADLRAAFIAALRSGQRRPLQTWIDRHRPTLIDLFPELDPSLDIDRFPFWPGWLRFGDPVLNGWVAADGRAQIR